MKAFMPELLAHLNLELENTPILPILFITISHQIILFLLKIIPSFETYFYLLKKNYFLNLLF